MYKYKVSFSQNLLSTFFEEVTNHTSGSVFLRFKSPGCSNTRYNFRGIYKKNKNEKISESDACGLEEFLLALKNGEFKDEKNSYPGYRPLLREEINYCIDTLKREHGVNRIPSFNLNINGEVIDFQEEREKGRFVNKSHVF